MRFFKVIKSGQAALMYQGAINTVSIMLVEGDHIMANEKYIYWCYPRERKTKESITNIGYIKTLLDKGVIVETKNDFK